MKKQIKSALFSGVFSLLSAIPAFAGTWQQNGPVWTYTKDDGTKATSEWIQYKEKWYHFGNDSIMQTGWRCNLKNQIGGSGASSREIYVKPFGTPIPGGFAF